MTQDDLLARIRGWIGADRAVREVPMFGVRAVMLDDAMLVAVGKDGGLLARVAPEHHDRLLQRPGASQAFMGTGRSMGPGWIRVAADAAEDELDDWLRAAAEYHGRT